MNRPALHTVGLPHTQITKEYISCAYTQKHLKFVNMMTSIGYPVYSYGSEEDDSKATEHICVIDKEKQGEFFGENDFHSKFFNITWGPDDPHWCYMNSKAIEEIRKRIQPRDIICIIAGYCQKEIADAFPAHQTVEYGIGYAGAFSNYKVFESYAHMHWFYGSQKSDNGQYYDAVIPNYFDPADFEYSAEKDDYYLFIGRSGSSAHRGKYHLCFRWRHIYG